MGTIPDDKTRQLLAVCVHAYTGVSCSLSYCLVLMGRGERREAGWRWRVEGLLPVCMCAARVPVRSQCVLRSRAVMGPMCMCYVLVA